MLSSKKLYFTAIDSNNMHDSALLYQIHTFKSKTKIIKKTQKPLQINGSAEQKGAYYTTMSNWLTE